MNPTALYKVSYGLYVVSSKIGDKFNGQIANTVNQVTAEPAQVSIALNKKNLTHDYIRDSGVFSASVLSQETPMAFIDQFGFKSGRELDKFNNIEYQVGKSGVPIVLENTVAFLEAKVVNSMDVGTHTIFVGELMDADIVKDHEPMTYLYYHRIKGGKSPENAPTYQKAEPVVGSGASERYKCQICGYIYDPKTGDPQNSIAVGTAFEKLPADWVCPICSADKTKFEKVP